jgi:hypothetical protein
MSFDPEASLLRVAARQHSVFTRGQALELGVASSTIGRRVAAGRWLSLHRGVYASTPGPEDWRRRVMAGVLACGPTAIASHRSAAAIWGLVTEIEMPEVTVASSVDRSHPGIVVHRSMRVEKSVHGSFRVSAPMRTVLDLAAVLPADVLERILDDVHRRSLIDLRRFVGYLALPANLHMAGSSELRGMVAVRDPDNAIESDLETLLFAALRRAGLPLPVPQHPVSTRRGLRYIDFAYPGPQRRDRARRMGRSRATPCFRK